MPTRRSKTEPLRQPLVDLVHRALHAERRAHRALGVVLVRDRRAEQRHHVVADVLVHGAAVALDLLPEPPQRAVHERLHGLGVEALGHGRVAGQIGEQHGHAAALLRQGGLDGSRARRRAGGHVQRAAAARAEAGARRRLGPAVGAAACECGPTGHAETRAGGIFGAAGRAGEPGHVFRVPPAQGTRPAWRYTVASSASSRSSTTVRSWPSTSSSAPGQGGYQKARSLRPTSSPGRMRRMASISSPLM